MINNSIYNTELLTGKYYPKAIAYYFRQWNDFHMTFHKHDRIEIMYIIEG